MEIKTAKPGVGWRTRECKKLVSQTWMNNIVSKKAASITLSFQFFHSLAITIIQVPNIMCLLKL